MYSWKLISKDPFLFKEVMGPNISDEVFTPDAMWSCNTIIWQNYRISIILVEECCLPGQTQLVMDPQGTADKF